MLLLSGSGLVPEGPEQVQIDNKTYKTGFYGTLFPHEYSLTEYTVKSDDLTLVRIAHDAFDLYHADVGPYTTGTIYCEESQYEQVLAYYSNPENYAFFCDLGVSRIDGTSSIQTVELSNVDPVLFDDLLNFAEKSSYVPFNSLHNSKVKTVELPMPDHTVDTRIVFYKESNDSLFCSSKGYDFYIIDNVLYMVYQYDGHDEDEKLIAVKAPENISGYFVSLMEPFLK